MEAITWIQLIVLVAYFLFVYAYKFLLTASKLSDQTKTTLRVFIPAANLIFGIVLGFFGVADFDITLAVMGTLATGGVADIVKIPKKLK